MKYKLLITDYDGTLGDYNEIAKDTLDAINDYKARGGKFVICTGRSYKSILPICQRFDIKGEIICFQGAVICDIESGKRIYDGGCDKQDILEIQEKLTKLGLSCGIYLDDYAHFEDSESEYLKIYIQKVGALAVNVDNLAKTVLESNLKIRKVIALGDVDIVTRAQRLLSKEYEGRLIVNTSSPNLLEVVAPYNSKGESVKRIASYFNIPLSEVITVGDSLNDIELVKGEWHGVAVGSAVDELKEVAKEITVPYCEQPIKHLIEKYS